MLDHRLEQRGWDREVVQRPLRVAELLAELRERPGVQVVAVDVAEQLAQPCERRVVDAAVLGQARVHPLEQRLTGPARARDAHHGDVEVPAPHHRLQRGEDPLGREVAGDAEQDQRVGDAVALAAPCPPHRSRLPAAPWTARTYDGTTRRQEHR